MRYLVFQTLTFQSEIESDSEELAINQFRELDDDQKEVVDCGQIIAEAA